MSSLEYSFYGHIGCQMSIYFPPNLSEFYFGFEQFSELIKKAFYFEVSSVLQEF